ncbi:hypothetical protein [Enterobacter sp. UNJFSC 003]|uniref:hypothetical protein n=1 Tax=Enterobacter sp. UNJFSC 003 TaxID=3122077 RepID=UPI002EC1B8CB|nr:hypothetical protein [Serratia liquefaciens]
MKQYNNDPTPEILSSFDKPAFSDKKIAEMGQQWQELITKQQTELQQHPVNEIFRIEIEGSLTRDGGILKTATSTSEVEISTGQKLGVAQTQDAVVYPEGTEATIISGAGEAEHNNARRSVALVGSRLSNGDEITSTPQGSEILVLRRGIPAAKGFLVDNFEVDKMLAAETAH